MRRSCAARRLAAVLAVVVPALAAGEVAAVNNPVPYKCRGGSFTLKLEGPDTMLLILPGRKPERLTRDPDDPDRATWKSARYTYYAFKRFVSLTDKGPPEKVLDACNLP